MLEQHRHVWDQVKVESGGLFISPSYWPKKPLASRKRINSFCLCKLKGNILKGPLKKKKKLYKDFSSSYKFTLWALLFSLLSGVQISFKIVGFTTTLYFFLKHGIFLTHQSSAKMNICILSASLSEKRYSFLFSGRQLFSCQ